MLFNVLLGGLVRCVLYTLCRIYASGVLRKAMLSLQEIHFSSPSTPFFNDLIPRPRNGRWFHTTYGQLIMCISTELISCHQQCALFGSDLEGDIIMDELLEGDTQQFICHSPPLVSQWLCSALSSCSCGVCAQHHCVLRLLTLTVSWPTPGFCVRAQGR